MKKYESRCKQIKVNCGGRIWERWWERNNKQSEEILSEREVKPVCLVKAAAAGAVAGVDEGKNREQIKKLFSFLSSFSFLLFLPLVNLSKFTQAISKDF